MTLIFRKQSSWSERSVQAWYKQRYDHQMVRVSQLSLSADVVLNTQQQYKFVYMAIKAYIESQQALNKVVS